MTILTSYWLFFIKPLYKSQGPINNSNLLETIESVKWKTLNDPVFHINLQYPEEWETSITQIVQLGSKMNRSWPTATIQTRSKNNMQIPDGTINVYIGRTNKLLFYNSFKIQQHLSIIPMIRLYKLLFPLRIKINNKNIFQYIRKYFLLSIVN